MPTLLAARRAFLREHRAVLSDLLAAALPQWTIPRPNGGLSLWVGLDRPRSSALVDVCADLGLSLVAGPKFSPGGAFERFLRIPFTSPIEDLRRGVDVLADAWRELGARPARAAHSR